MLVFVAPTFDKSYTWFSLALCILLILTPTDHRFALLTFIAGSGLGYYLELWGTTRQCWTYYTYQTPPLFAVLAHGMASGRVLAGRINGKNSLGEIWLLKTHKHRLRRAISVNSSKK